MRDPATLYDSEASLALLDIVGHLGKGQFGDVTLVRHRTTGEHFAVKKLPLRNKRDWEVRQIHEEVHMLRVLKADAEAERPLAPAQCHDHLLRLVAAVMLPHEVNIVTRFYSGGTAEQLELFVGVPAQQRALVAGVAAGLAAAHANRVVHRDVALKNIMRHELADGRVVYVLIDVGLGRVAADETRGAGIVGTRDFCAPEIFDVPRRYSPASDVWALGVVLFMAVRGLAPFDTTVDARRPGYDGGDAVRAADAGALFADAPELWLDADLRDLVARCLDRDPARRITLPELRAHAWLRGAA